MEINTPSEISGFREALPSAIAQERPKYRNFGFFLQRMSLIRSNPIFKDNFPLIAIVLAYISVIYSAHALFGIHGKVVLKFYYDWFARMAILFSAFFFLFHILKRSYRSYLTLRSWVGFLAIFILLPVFKSAFASFKQTIPLINDFSWDVALMRLDYILHFGHHPWRLLEPILSHPIILRAIDFLYLFWFIVLFLFCLWMAWTQKRHLRLCFFVSTLLVWSLLGSGMGTIFSSAGPCYYSKIAPAADNPFAPLMLKLSAIHQNTSLWAISNQVGLWEANQSGTWLPFGGISAMPSIHLAMATLFALLALNVHKGLGIVFIAYAVIMQIGSVILGWHYALDGYAGIILASLIWYMVRRIVKHGLD